MAVNLPVWLGSIVHTEPPNQPWRHQAVWRPHHPYTSIGKLKSCCRSSWKTDRRGRVICQGLWMKAQELQWDVSWLNAPERSSNLTPTPEIIICILTKHKQNHLGSSSQLLPLCIRFNERLRLTRALIIIITPTVLFTQSDAAERALRRKWGFKNSRCVMRTTKDVSIAHKGITYC